MFPTNPKGVGVNCCHRDRILRMGCEFFFFFFYFSPSQASPLTHEARPEVSGHHGKKDWKRSMKWLRCCTCTRMHIIHQIRFGLGLDWTRTGISPYIHSFFTYEYLTHFNPPSIDQSLISNSLLHSLSLSFFFFGFHPAPLVA